MTLQKDIQAHRIALRPELQESRRQKTQLVFAQAQQSYLWQTDKGKSRIVKY